MIQQSPTERADVNSIYEIAKNSPRASYQDIAAVDERDVDAALGAYVPGGASALCWLPMKDGHTIEPVARDVMRSAIAAVDKRRALSQAAQPAEADGWVMVPREPTEKMIDAADQAFDLMPDTPEELSEVYRVMIAATPKAPATDAKHDPDCGLLFEDGPEECTCGAAVISTDAGYQQAFYTVAELLAIPAQTRSPQEVWESDMLPALRSLIALKQSTPKAPATDAGEKVWRLARFMGEQTERETIVDWLKSVGDSKPHGTDWRTYYEIAEAIEEGRHEGDTTPTPTQEVSADDVVSRDSERALLSGHDGDLGKDDRGSGRDLARKEPLCDTCNDTGAIGYLPDDYQSCPNCNSDDSNPSNDSAPWFQLGWHKERLATAERERDEWKERALTLRLATPPAPNDDLRAALEAAARVADAECSRIAALIRDYPIGEQLAAIPVAIRALKENRRG